MLAPINSPEKKDTGTKAKIQEHVVNVGALVGAVGITVFASLYDDFSNDLDKAMCILVSVVGIFTAIYNFTIPTPPKYKASILDTLRYKCKVCLNAAPNLYNIYLDIAVCVQFANEGSKELLYFSIASIVLCRLLCTYWVWKRFHSLRYCFMQFFEAFQFREMRRILECDTIILSLHRLQEITIMCEHIPQYLAHIEFIAQEHSKGNSVNVVIYSSIFLKVLTFTMGTKDLDLFMWERFAHADSEGEKNLPFLRLCEAFSSVLTIGIIQYHYSWYVSVPVILCIFLFTFLMSDGSWTDSDLFVHSFIWVIRSPTITYDSFGYNWLAKERRKRFLENLEISTKQFYDQCNKALIGKWKATEYVEIMSELYENYEFVDHAQELTPSVCGFFQGWAFWDYKFYIVHLSARSVFNLIWLIVIQIEAQDLNEYVRWTYLGLALIVQFIIAFLLTQRVHIEPLDDDEETLPLHDLIKDCVPAPSGGRYSISQSFGVDTPAIEHAQNTPANTPAVERPRGDTLTVTQSYIDTPHVIDMTNVPPVQHENTLTVVSLSPAVTTPSVSQSAMPPVPQEEKTRAILMENMVYLGYALNGKNKHGETLLSLAARNNDANMIRYLISAGFDPNEADGLGQTPLCVSILFQRHNAIKAFLPDCGKHNALEVIFPCFPVVDVNLPCTGSYELSPLSCCAARCDIETAKLLRNRGADIGYDALGGNLYHGLFDSQDSDDKKLAFLKELLTWDGIDINQKLGLQEIAKKQKNKNWMHVEYKEVTVLWRFIQQWSGIEEDDEEDKKESSKPTENKEESSFPPEKKETDEDEEDKKEDAQEIKKKILTPEQVKERKSKQMQFIQMLLEHDADPNHNCLPMHCALTHGNNEIIDLLLKHNADPDQIDENDNTLLTNCLYCDDERTGISKDIDLVQCVDSLLKANADLDFEFWDYTIRDIVLGKDKTSKLHKGVQNRILEELPDTEFQVDNDVRDDSNSQSKDILEDIKSEPTSVEADDTKSEPTDAISDNIKSDDINTDPDEGVSRKFPEEQSDDIKREPDNAASDDIKSEPNSAVPDDTNTDSDEGVSRKFPEEQSGTNNTVNDEPDTSIEASV